MAKVIVKNNAGVETIHDNIDTIILPTTTGEGQVYRRWNGIDTLTTTARVSCLNGGAVCLVPGMIVETVVSAEPG